jgi:hypothetical protein
MNDKIDFTHIVDFIFKNRNNYYKLTDEDKKKFFFIINRKFAAKYPLQADFFNSKFIDKDSALDVWYNYFNKMSNIPSWYWTKTEKIKNNKFTNKEVELFKKYNEYFSDKDLDFIFKYFEDEVRDELKILKKYEKE